MIYLFRPRRGPLRHLGKLGCVRSDPSEPTSTGIGVGRGGAATHLCVEITSFRVECSYSILDSHEVRCYGSGRWARSGLSFACTIPHDSIAVAGASAPYRWVGIARQDCSYEPEPLWSGDPCGRYRGPQNEDALTSMMGAIQDFTLVGTHNCPLFDPGTELMWMCGCIHDRSPWSPVRTDR